MKKTITSTLKLFALTSWFGAAFGQISTTYTYTGGMQTYTVPGGVTTLTLDVKGAQGGFGYNAPSSPPGSGGRVQAVLTVTPGEVLNIYVGGKGVDGTATAGGLGGYNGGGLGGTWSGGRCGGGGGGASDIRKGGNTLANRVVVASGGGGTGVNYSIGNSGGNGGGLNGANGLTGTYLGAGATQIGGGAPNGVLGIGGPGGVGQTGGGGGGGYYGGGGSAWEGGGGGSSYSAPSGVTSVVHTSGFQTGNGEIIITSIVPPGAALNFDGTSDNVALSASIHTALAGSSALTLEAWIKPSSLTGPRAIICNHTGGSTQFVFQQINSSLEFFCTAAPSVITAANTLTLNVWQHIAAVFNGTSYRIYINGNLSASSSFAANTIPNPSQQVPRIGADGFNQYFAGDMDEVRIWNRPLCQGEIQNNMIGQLSLPQTNLLAYYQFNQGFAGGSNLTTTSLTALAGPTGTLQTFALTGATSNWVAPGGVSSTSTVTTFVSPTLSIASPTTICSGSSATLTASGVSSYTWTSGPTTATFAVTPGVTTTYSVVGTATNGCLTNVTTRTINVNATPTVAINNNTICGTGSTGVLSTTVTGTGPYTYAWSTGSTLTAISGLTPGTYAATVTAANGCFGSTSAVVISNPIPTVAVNSGTICSGSTFTIVPSGANTYTIQGGSAAVSPTANASYTVIGTSTAGCVSANTATSNVTVNAAPSISVNSGAICAGNSFTMTPSGASTYTFSGGSAVVSPTATSAYTVTGTNTVGCNGSAVSNVTVNALPTVSAASSNTTFICVGSTATLTAAGANTYVWNTTATTAVIAVSPTTTTSYTVTGTGANGCSANAVISQSVNTCTGINSNISTLTSNFIVYPNPSNGIFNVQLENAATIELTDVLGRVILTDKVNAGNYQLNLGNNVNGVYFIKATVNGKTKTVKVVKE